MSRMRRLTRRWNRRRTASPSSRVRYDFACGSPRLSGSNDGADPLRRAIADADWHPHDGRRSAPEISLLCEAVAGVMVEGDGARLKQVVANLLDNAIKYTSSGGRVVIKVLAWNERAFLEVEDTGVGIAREAIPHVFERFYRTDKARTRQQGGTGLGLSIVKSICTAHAGEVHVESTEGRGSRFWVDLPLSPLLTNQGNLG